MRFIKYFLAIVCLSAINGYAADSEWPSYGLNYANQRYSDNTQIHTANVAKLVKAWSHRTGVKATFQIGRAHV